MRNILVGGACPYANGSLHIGHIAGLLPGDVLARYIALYFYTYENMIMFFAAVIQGRKRKLLFQRGCEIGV